MAKLKQPRMDISQIEFKPAFIERYSALTDWEKFKEASLLRLRRSIRVNTLKTTSLEIQERLEKDWKLTPVPWCKDGFYAEHHEGRRDLGNTLEHQIGYYYIQEAASMIPPLAISPWTDSVGLDMCAAPGSKTSQLAQLMQNTGCLVANDYRGDRLSPLGMNLMRCGVLNTVMSLHEGDRFGKFKELFDWVLVDAPCSGTGTIRKSLKTINIWNPMMITKLSNQQKRLLDAAWETCKTGGTIVYSTCSVEPEEDEGVVDHLMKKHPDAHVEKIALEGLKAAKPVMSFSGVDYDDRVTRALRLWPQDNDTEGFFVCRIRKEE
ncbi:MAG: NOL1/NOP2/sun family putative RNA methylase [Nanoarchaeota archaeon]